MTLGFNPNPERPLDIIHVDIFISEKMYFLSAVDKCSRFGSLTPIKSESTLEVDVGKGLTIFTKSAVQLKI